ncbi:hypothetical protein [Geobacillus stearothermophilus]|uniref:hypothetical protein n=1 Tax=Geobacillus stearothermophilus TaxID=1422 RepID=UPI002E22C3F8|nr:hypothetical protein [Geobacillus stearothermophilus]
MNAGSVGVDCFLGKTALDTALYYARSGFMSNGHSLHFLQNAAFFLCSPHMPAVSFNKLNIHSNGGKHRSQGDKILQQKKNRNNIITSDINKKRVMRYPLNKKVFYEEDKKGVEVSSNTSTPSAQHIR